MTPASAMSRLRPGSSPVRSVITHPAQVAGLEQMELMLLAPARELAQVQLIGLPRQAAAAFGSSCVGSHRGGQQPAEAVKICGRIQVKLEPVPPRRITPDGPISTEAVLNA
jgi:hypothetical protein